MVGWRSAGLLLAVAVLNLKITTCRSPAQSETGTAPEGEAKSVDVTLPGVDTSSLTTREKRMWSDRVSELLAPCPKVASSLAECVKQKRECPACLHGAKFLVAQVRQGKTNSQVENAYRARFSPDKVQDIPIGDSPVKGPADAPVVIIEFADFECPACAAAMPTLDEIFKGYPGKIRFAFKNFPLSTHPNAETAARAAVAAQRQGKFWEMHTAMFSAGAPLDRVKLERLAREVRLDVKKFLADLVAEPVADRVAEDRKQGERLDLQGTPSIFINGRRFDPSISELDEWVELEFELKGVKAQRAAAVPAGSAGPQPSGATQAKQPGK